MDRADWRSELFVMKPTTPSAPEAKVQNLIVALNLRFRDVYSQSIAALGRRLNQHPQLATCWPCLNEFLLTPGKRLRPSLFLGSYHAVAELDAPAEDAIFRVAAALEIFHTFALIHDDVIDRSNSRRGKPTLHRCLEKRLGFSDEQAGHLAVIIGDILFGFAIECFLDPALDAGRARDALRHFTLIAQDTGIGEASEIVQTYRDLDEITEEEIRQTYALKTGRYTIECPLVCGAILGGARADVIQTLQRFSHSIGMAYQIENDLHEIDTLEEGLTELAYDLQSGVKTLFLLRTRDSLGSAERAILNRYLQTDQSTPSLPLTEILVNSPARRELKDEVESLFDDAREVLERSGLNVRQRMRIAVLLDYIDKNRHHSEKPAVSAAL